MRKRSIEEWIKYYQEHGGDKDLRLAPDEIIQFHEEHGFITYFINKNEDVLEIHHICGDGKYWVKFLKNTVMSIFNLKKIRAFTHRNPKAWARKYGNVKVIGYEVEIDRDEIRN